MKLEEAYNSGVPRAKSKYEPLLFLVSFTIRMQILDYSFHTRAQLGGLQCVFSLLNRVHL